jgi:ubiquinol-cytochrome c reductase cytochrome b subunit
MGVIAMGAAIAVLFVLPWLDRSPVRSMRYKGWLSKVWLLVFCVAFVILGVLGVLAPTPGVPCCRRSVRCCTSPTSC